MNNLHDEEYGAEVRQYVLWCEGRLKELAEAGLVKGESALTEKGWAEYRSLVASGFVPAREKVIWTMRGNQQVPSDVVEQMATLMLQDP